MTDERLPTPDLLAGDCVHSRMVSRADDECLSAACCGECVTLALSRARDEGIEAAAHAAYEAVSCAWCGTGERNEDDPPCPCLCTEERARVAAAIRALKEDRQR